MARTLLVGQKWNTLRLLEVLVEAHSSSPTEHHIHVIEGALGVLCNLTCLTSDPTLYQIFSQPLFLTFHAQVISQLEMMPEGVAWLHLTLTVNLVAESAALR